MFQDNSMSRGAGSEAEDRAAGLVSTAFAPLTLRSERSAGS